jgi:flagellar motor protein MotB
LITSGKGDLEPLKNESEIYGEAVNRRVEIFFISK